MNLSRAFPKLRFDPFQPPALYRIGQPAAFGRIGRNCSAALGF